MLTALAGGALGAGLGFFASQVFVSDWESNPDDGKIDRRPWAAVGASIGLTVGFSFPLGGASRAPRTVAAQPRHKAITEQEIRGSSARSLSELLRELRPAWLRSRGVDVITLSRDSRKSPGVRVYLNGGLLGGLNDLDEVSIDLVTRIEFFDTEAAVLRWGAGNEDGAILLTTQA